MNELIINCQIPSTQQKMSQSGNILVYDLKQLTNIESLQRICEKQKKLIDLLQKQMDNFKNVMLQMQKDIDKLTKTLQEIATQYNVNYKNMQDLDDLLPNIQSKVSKLIQNQLNNIKSQIKAQQIIKEVPVFVQKQIEIVRQIEKPIFVEKIKEVQKPIYVEKIIQISCNNCQLSSPKRIKT